MIRGVLSSTLLALGGMLVLLGVATVAYAQWAEWQHQAQQPTGHSEALPARLDVAAAESTPTPVPTPPTPWAFTAATPTAGPERPPTPTPTPVARDGPPLWIEIPSIGVNSRVMPVWPRDGVYTVPSWDVGHHADSADPGEWGNSVYVGHVETISAGRVFARLADLRPGDAVYVYTKRYRFDWAVTDVRTVPNSDTSFFRQTPDARITLYTCTGWFDPTTRDYSERLVVTGRLVRFVPRQ